MSGRASRRVWSLCLPLLVWLALVPPGEAEGKAVGGSEWPRWRGADFNDSSRESGVFPDSFALEPRWIAGLGSGYSGIVVSRGRAVTMASDGTSDVLAALDTDSGSELWRVVIAPTYPGREGSNDGPTSTPAIDGDRVFALGPRGDLLAVDLVSGEVEWRRRLVEELGAALPHWGFTTSPLVSGDLVIVLTGGQPDQAVTAFDKTSGETVWRAGSDQASYQSPLLVSVEGRRQLIVGGDRSLHALDPLTGEELRSSLHGGVGFYRRVLNPVLIDGRSLLLTYRPDEAKLVPLAREDEPIWSSRYLGRNYATPIYHQGYIYGYSGRFLSCIDAATGELVWRSRPPGDGFLILVDGHLVVQTKNGSLHVAEATPEGYREQASLDLFSLLSWTPPSFADGRFYARESFAEIAAVDVVPLDSASDSVAGERVAGESAAGAGSRPAGAPHEPARAVVSGRLPLSEFARWVAEVEDSSDPQARVRRFLERQTTFPVIEGDRWAHIVYHGEARDVALRADFLESGQELPLHRVAGNDLYYASVDLEPDARVHYQFVRNLEETTADPRNPVRGKALNYAGEVSLLLMPGGDRPPASTESGTEDRKRLVAVPFATERVAVLGKTWGGERDVLVYLPPDYDHDPSRRWPTLYVLYGQRMLETAHLDSVLDRLAGKAIQPLIAVFVESISPYEYARSQRHVHGRMLAEQLVPLIDGRFRTRPEARHRAIFGVDEGGYAAVELGLRYPSVFGGVAAMSLYPVGKGAEELLERIGPARAHAPRFYIDWGRYDQRQEAERLDVRRFSSQVNRHLAASGYSVGGREWNDGSDLIVWSLRSEEALRELFPLRPPSP